ncbi:MAG: hypothetical protein LBC82_07845 [Oscillospiraceae bacterium]|jgi:Fe-S-cluster containining protein|nr:hypothetical protein [Oscillospiraceae bacterium]
MLNRILTEADCAQCRLCCSFFESEIWEMPTIDEDFTELYKDYNFGEICFDENGLYRCPALGEAGCKLGSNRPFDCKLWPFRAMKLGEFTVVTVSPLCKKVSEKPLAELSQFVNFELADKIKARVLKYPAQIKDYIKDYPILKVL